MVNKQNTDTNNERASDCRVWAKVLTLGAVAVRKRVKKVKTSQVFAKGNF